MRGELLAVPEPLILPWKIVLQKATAPSVVHKRRQRMTRPPLVFELQVYFPLYSGLNEEHWKKAIDQSPFFLLSGMMRRGLNRAANFWYLKTATVLSFWICPTCEQNWNSKVQYCAKALDRFVRKALNELRCMSAQIQTQSKKAIFQNTDLWNDKDPVCVCPQLSRSFPNLSARWVCLSWGHFTSSERLLHDHLFILWLLN